MPNLARNSPPINAASACGDQCAICRATTPPCHLPCYCADLGCMRSDAHAPHCLSFLSHRSEQTKAGG
eukprot:5579035-Pleurochrysis_carterae.AAC.1